MTTEKMHADEIPTGKPLVRRLLAAQFPHWSGLPLEPAIRSGTDNAIFRLGGSMAVRLPRIHWAAGQVEKEHRWLPVLSSLLPLEVPVPLAMGKPGEGYPYNWSVYPWLEGVDRSNRDFADPGEAARDLARFIMALQGIDPKGGPVPGEHNSNRGEPLANRDKRTRQAVSALGDAIDTRAVLRAWETALDVSWSGCPVWIHGDLQGGNLLVREGRLSAVIDFGCLGIGDPACDLIPAWNMLDARSRRVFREMVHADDGVWARGRGWALSIALIALPYYRETNPGLAETARRTIQAVVSDFTGEG